MMRRLMVFCLLAVALPAVAQVTGLTVRDISPAVFTGVGLNDMATSGAFTNATPLNYVVAIDAAGTPDTFKWSSTGGSTWNQIGVAITGAAQALNYGVKITFGATTGHTLNDSWAFTASRADAYLAWSTGTGPYSIIRADMPQMSTRTITLTGTASPITDAGARSDGARLHCYIINDSTTAPTVAVTTPAASFTSAAPCICASGTASVGALATYCNAQATTGTPQAWAACQNGHGVPLAVQADPKTGNAITVTAACVDANTNWAYVVVTGSYTGTITTRVTCVPRGQGM